MARLVAFSFFLFALIGCQKHSKTTDFKIDLDVLIKENDSLHVFYTTTKSIDFNETDSFWKKIKGSKKNQIITLNFPDTIAPKQVRIDFGNNAEQKEIVLNEITFLYKKKLLNSKGKDIYRYFRVDESNTILDKHTGILKRRDTLEAKGPSLYPNGDFLYEKLNHFIEK